MLNVGDKVRVTSVAHGGTLTGKTGTVRRIHEDGGAVPIEVELDSSNDALRDAVFDLTMTMLFGDNLVPFDEAELELL